MGAIEDPEIGKFGPWFEALINANQEGDILRIIAAHPSPGFRITLYTTTPEFGPRIRYFPADSEITAEIIKLIAVKFECAPGELQGVYRFEGGRWLKTMDG